MTDLVYDFITTGVDLLLIGAVLSAMIVMMRGSTQLTQLISTQQTTTEEFNLYLKYHMYDNQDNLSTADAISAMVGYRYDLYVCIEVDDKCYMNDPETGKYYLVNGTAGDNTTAGLFLGKTAPDVRTSISGGTQKTYQEILDTIDSTNLYHASLAVLDGGVFKTEGYSRNSVILGILLKKTN